MAENDTASASSATPTEELDLMIPDMDTETAENQVKKVLERLPGIRYVRLVQRGALVRDKPASIGPDEIRTAIRQSGFRASTFSGLEDRDAGTSVDRRGTEPNSLGKKPDGTLSSHDEPMQEATLRP